MKTLQVIGGIIILMLFGIIGLLIFLSPEHQEQPIGGVNIANEYHATTTRDMTADAEQLIQTGGSVLGSVIVASSSATNMSIWNATSTTDIASTTLTTFDADLSNGTYTFDTIMTRGIIIDLPASFDGDYVITYR